jgi:hypothetical protein
VRNQKRLFSRLYNIEQTSQGLVLYHSAVAMVQTITVVQDACLPALLSSVAAVNSGRRRNVPGEGEISSMRANVLRGVNKFQIEELEKPHAGVGEAVTTLCPGGNERMRRLMEVVRAGRVDLTPLLTHTVPLDQIERGYRIFGERLDGVLKVAVKP